MNTLQVTGIKRFSGYHLKMIALITMLIDHIAAVVIWRIYAESFHITASMSVLSLCYVNELDINRLSPKTTLNCSRLGQTICIYFGTHITSSVR